MHRGARNVIEMYLMLISMGMFLFLFVRLSSKQEKGLHFCKAYSRYITVTFYSPTSLLGWMCNQKETIKHLRRKHCLKQSSQDKPRTTSTPPSNASTPFAPQIPLSMNRSTGLSYAAYVCTRGELKRSGTAQGEKSAHSRAVQP